MQGVPTITGCGEEAAQLALRGPAAVLLDAAQQGVAEAVLWIGSRFLGPGDFWDSCELGSFGLIPAKLDDEISHHMSFKKVSLFGDPQRKGWSCKEGPTPLVSMAVCFILGLCKVHFLEDDAPKHEHVVS